MDSFLILLSGEFKRMHKYKVSAASIFVALIWIGVLALTEITEVTFVFPLLIFVDATSMAILMVGVTIFFERGEGSLRALLVAPISRTDYLLAKIVVTVCTSVLTLSVLYLYAFYFKEMSIFFPGLLGAVVLVSLFHGLVGFILSYRSREFTTLLINMMKYMFVFFLPVILEHLNLIQHSLLEVLLYAAPTKAALILLYAPGGDISGAELAYALAYMGIGSIVLFFFVNRLFSTFTAREGGV